MSLILVGVLALDLVAALAQYALLRVPRLA